MVLISWTKLLKAISKDPYLSHVFNQADISNKSLKDHFGRHLIHIPTILGLHFLIKHQGRRNKFLLTAISYYQQLDSYFPPSCVMQIIRPSCILLCLVDNTFCNLLDVLHFYGLSLVFQILPVLWFSGDLHSWVTLFRCPKMLLKNLIIIRKNIYLNPI